MTNEGIKNQNLKNYYFCWGKCGNARHAWDRRCSEPLV